MAKTNLSVEEVTEKRLKLESEYQSTIEEINTRKDKELREAKKKVEEIDTDKYRELYHAKEKMESDLRLLQAECPHRHSRSGDGGSLDYWFECDDCGL